MLETLEKRRKVLIEYLLMKADEQDWHGVADAAMDLREIDATRLVLKQFETPTIMNNLVYDNRGARHD